VSALVETDGLSESDAVVVVLEQEETAPPSVSEQAEEVARAAATLSLRGAELAAARRLPELRPVARDVVGLAVLSVALITAFGFGNWGAASALSTVMSDWQAALVLTATWIAIGILVAAVLLRGGPLARNWRRVVAPASADNLQERQEGVDQAERELRESIDRLGEAIADAAERKIAAAVLPLAGGMVEVGEEMVDATDEIIEKADEITDVIEERLPGGVVVNRVFDFVLVPGRFGIRIARSVLSVDRNE
jgi:hypothetical protein